MVGRQGTPSLQVSRLVVLKHVDGQHLALGQQALGDDVGHLAEARGSGERRENGKQVLFDHPLGVVAVAFHRRGECIHRARIAQVERQTDVSRQIDQPRAGLFAEGAAARHFQHVFRRAGEVSHRREVPAIRRSKRRRILAQHGRQRGMRAEPDDVTPFRVRRGGHCRRSRNEIVVLKLIQPEVVEFAVGTTCNVKQAR